MSHRPNILKLATKISLESLTYTGITYNDPEYKILEPIVDDDMCEIMMHMRLEANRTAEEIARRAKKGSRFYTGTAEQAAYRRCDPDPYSQRRGMLVLPHLGTWHYGRRALQPGAMRQVSGARRML